MKFKDDVDVVGGDQVRCESFFLNKFAFIFLDKIRNQIEPLS